MLHWQFAVNTVCFDGPVEATRGSEAQLSRGDRSSLDHLSV